MLSYKVCADLCRFLGRLGGKEDQRTALLAQVGCYVKDYTTCLVYEHYYMTIVVDTQSLAFVCWRKENNNPVLSSDEEGKLVRSHGETRYLHDLMLAECQDMLKGLITSSLKE